MSISLQGPSGSSGDLTSTISIIEGVSEITTFTASNFVETVDWSLANGDDQDLFSINKSSGELIFKNAPDFESPSDIDKNNDYIVTVKAVDSSQNEALQTLTISVKDHIWDQIGPDVNGGSTPSWASRGSSSLSSNGSILAVGSPDNSENGTDSGKVSIFNYDVISHSWIQIGEDIKGNAIGDHFGTSVKLSDDGSIIAIGANGVDENGKDSGQVRIFENISNVWTPVGSNINGVSKKDLSGSTIGLSGDGSILSIGAQLNDENGEDSGHVRIFKYDGDTWNQLGQTITGEEAGDLSGSSIGFSDDGETIAIGARKHDGINGVDSGHVKVFTYDSTSAKWIQKGKNIDGESVSDYSGQSVSLSEDGNIVAIGAPSSNDFKGETRVFSFDIDSDDWQKVGQTIVGSAIDDYSGYSVNLSDDGTIVAIGNYVTSSWATGVGAHTDVYKLDTLTDQWEQLGNKISSDGRSVSLSNDGVVLAVQKSGYYHMYHNNRFWPLISGPSGDQGSSTSNEYVNENKTEVFTFSSNEKVIWSISGGADNALFNIDPSTGNLTFKSSPDFENPTDTNLDNTYEVVVNATDYLDISREQSVSIGIVNVVELEDTGVVNHQITIDENTLDVHKFETDIIATWSISEGEDAELFSIDQNGSLTFKEAPDWEVPNDSNTDNNYQVSIRATDQENNIANTALTITVADVDDTPPLIKGPSGNEGDLSSELSIEENTSPFIKFAANESVSWAINGGSDATLFSLKNIYSEGLVHFISSPDWENALDSDGDNIYQFKLQATDLEGNTSEQNVSISVTDVDDTPPLIQGPSGEGGDLTSLFEEKENINTTIKFSANEEVQWALNGGADVELFTLTSEQGQGWLQFKETPDFEIPKDNDLDNRYEIVVKAEDLYGNISDQNVTILVGDIDDTPAKILGPSGLSGGSNSYSTLSENASEATYSFFATEEVNWSINGGEDKDLFSIINNDRSSGLLSFNTTPDYEKPLDMNLDNDYSVEVMATDKSGNTSNQIFTLSIANVLELNDSNISVNNFIINENSKKIHTFLADMEVEWSLNGGDDKDVFTIDINSGLLSFIEKPDFENPTDKDGDNKYIVNINATDLLGSSASQLVNIEVIDVAEPTYSININSTSIPIEGENIITTVNTTNIDNGTNVIWKLTGTGIDENDFSSGPISDVALIGEDGSFSFEHTIFNDQIVEGTETVNVELFSDLSMTDQIKGENTSFQLKDAPILEKVADPKSGKVNETDSYTEGEKYPLPHICDYDGNLQGIRKTDQVSNDEKQELKNSSDYLYQTMLDVNGDGDQEMIFTNDKNGRWATVSIDSTSGFVDFSDYSEGGSTRIVGIYVDPLVQEGIDNNGYLSDGITPAPVSDPVDPHRYLGGIDRLELNSQYRFQNDLQNDNLIPKDSGDYDNDGVYEVYWKTADDTAYLRALMHSDGNIKYANYQDQIQMNDYLTSHGHIKEISNII